MTARLEDILNLKKPDPITDTQLQEFAEDDVQPSLNELDKVDAALPQVTGLDKVSAELDDYAKKSIGAFEDIMHIAKSTNDKDAPLMFDSAAKMMKNAINATQQKINAKLKVVELQMKKQQQSASTPNDEVSENKIVGNRAELLKTLVAEVRKNSSKE